MATPAFQWGWREEENLVNSHVKRPRKNRSTQSRHRAPQAAARRLGANWIAYGPEENDFLESCFNMDPNHSGTSATTLMVKRAAASSRRRVVIGNPLDWSLSRRGAHAGPSSSGRRRAPCTASTSCA